MFRNHILRASLIFFLVMLMAGGYAQVNLPHFIRQGRIALYNNEYSEAIKHFNVVISRKTDPFEEYFYRVIAKYNLKDYLGAEHDFSRTLEIHPFYSRAYHYRGVTHAALMEKSKAIHDLNKALEFDPYNDEVLASRGAVYLQMGMYEKALRDFNEALMINDDQARSYLNRALAHKGLDNYAEALEDCNRAIEKKVFFKEALAQRGLIKYEMGWFSAALADFNEALKIDSENPKYYYYRAITKYQLNNIEGTLADYSRVLSLDPANALTYYNRAIIYSQIKEYQRAIRDYEKVAALNPNNVLTYFNRAHLYYEMEDYPSAIADYTKAINLFPQFARAYFMRSEAHRQAGNKNKARQDQQKGNTLIAAHDQRSDSRTKQTAWIDSTYFKKIIEFEADFRTAEAVAGKDTPTGNTIKPEPSFAFRLLPKSSYELHGIPNDYVSSFNQQERYKTRIILWKENPPLSRDSLRKMEERVDSLISFRAPDPGLYLLQGIISQALQNYSSAISSYSMALLNDPDYFPACLNRAHARYEMIQRSQKQAGELQNISLGRGNRQEEASSSADYSKVFEDLYQASAIDNNSSAALYNKGNTERSRKEYTQALQSYTRALNRRRDFAEAYYNRGLTLIYLQDSKRGCMDMSRAGELGIEEAYRVIEKYCNE